MNKVILTICLLLALFEINPTEAIAQSNIISGTVKNSKTQIGIPAVSVVVKGTSDGTYTDDNGNFKLYTRLNPPFTIVISSIGYAEKEVTVNAVNSPVNVEIEPSYQLGQDIVVAASRLPERILESPVSIERVNASAMRNAPGPNYYDILGALKGVDITTSSYTFKTVSTRGFNGSGNLRFNQLVDGMDNSAPALNFSVGNVIGLTELDVDNMELLSGASSALYGSGGMNGTLLISSKDPFKYQGVSFQIKQGVMHMGDSRRDASPFYDWSLRWGQKISDKFAFKFGAEFIKADDWQADDKTDLLRNDVDAKVIQNGNRLNDPNYDGVNVYGDEASASLSGIAQAGVFGPSNTSLPLVLSALGINAADGLSPAEQSAVLGFYATQDPSVYGPLPAFSGALLQGKYLTPDGKQIYASRTGYDEKDIVSYNSKNLKFSGGLYYKINGNTEASILANWGYGTTVYTGADRYNLKNFRIGQYKIEVKNTDWYIRAYTTQENSGDSYASTLTALSINSAWKDNATWFGEYAATYGGYALQGATPQAADAAARAYADQGRYLPGTQQFNDAHKKSVKTSIGNGGSQFADQSDIYQADGQWNLSKYVKVLDVLIGASYRLYNLDSHGTIFADTSGSIQISEYGAYIQLQKALFKDILKISASGRYDKK